MNEVLLGQPVAPAPLPGASDRSIGYVFCAVFVLIGIAPLLSQGEIRPWALAVAAVFLACALIRPIWLAPLNRLWTRLGHLLHRIVNPLVLGALFFLVITPIAVILRLMGRDPLARAVDPKCSSYWAVRQSNSETTMTQQF